MLGQSHFGRPARPIRRANLSGPGEIASAPIQGVREQIWREFGRKPRSMSPPLHIDMIPVAIDGHRFRAGRADPAFQRTRFEDDIGRNKSDEFTAGLPESGLDTASLALVANNLHGMF